MYDDSLTKVFETALGIHTPWTIDNTEFVSNDKKLGRLELHVYISFPKGSKFTCPICGEEYTSYDTRERVWRHLNFFQYRCYIHASVPRIQCSKHGVRTVDVPWGREGSGFTLMMEGVILSLLKHLAVKTVAEEIGEHDTKLWRILSYYVTEAKKTRDFSDVEAVGVDEYSHKGHDYITIFLSHVTEKNSKARVLDIQNGKGNDAVTSFGEVFCAHNGNKDAVTDITSDMCHGYRNSMQTLFSKATLTVDKFHVVKMVGEAVDNVRRRESNSKDKEKNSILKGTKYLWLTNRDNLSEKQANRLDELLSSENSLDTIIAYKYKLKLQELYNDSHDFESACSFFEDLVLEMANSSVHEIRKASESLTRNAVEILNYFISHKTNAILEGFNSKISLIKSKARGFRNMENFKNMIYFCMGGFDFPSIKIMA